MFEPVNSAGWQAIDAAVDVCAALALRELERMTDQALVAIGIPLSTVHRRRGQIRRYARQLNLQGVTK
jgi:hypothetical protein